MPIAEPPVLVERKGGECADDWLEYGEVKARGRRITINIITFGENREMLIYLYKKYLKS